MNAEPLSESGAAPTHHSRVNRFWIAVVAFLAYETLIIALLNGNLAGDITSDLLYLAIVIVGAGSGYLLLAAFTGAWESALATIFPIFIALAIGGSQQTDSLVTDGIPLYIAWCLFTAFFLPAWLLGLFIARLAEDPEDSP